jgi:hypothetical protein
VANKSTGYIHKAHSTASLLDAMRRCSDREELAQKGQSCLGLIDNWSCEKLALKISERLLAAA